MKLLLFTMTLACLVVPPSLALAGAAQPRIALHAQGFSAKNRCTLSRPDIEGLACENFVTAWPTGLATDVYLVVAEADSAAGVGAFSCGIWYDPPTAIATTWTLCADVDFKADGPNGPWPTPDSGNRILWSASTNCQQTVVGDGVMAVGGVLYIYAYQFTPYYVTENRAVASGPERFVADCAANMITVEPDRLGVLCLGGEPGCNPCTGLCRGDIFPFNPCVPPVAVRESSWGAVKSRYVETPDP